MSSPPKRVSVSVLGIGILLMMIASVSAGYQTTNTTQEIGIENPSMVLSDFRFSATRTIVIQDRDSETNLQIPFTFGWFEEEDGRYTLSVEYSTYDTVYQKDFRTLHSQYANCTMEYYPFLKMDGETLFDYWTPRTPNRTVIGESATFSSGKVVYGWEMNYEWRDHFVTVTSDEINSVPSCAGCVIALNNLSAEFVDPSEGGVYIDAVPDRIAFGVNISLNGAAWPMFQFIEEFSDSSDVIVEDNTITVHFADPLPIDPIYPSTIAGVSILLVGTISIIVIIRKRRK